MLATFSPLKRWRPQEKAQKVPSSVVANSASHYSTKSSPAASPTASPDLLATSFKDHKHLLTLRDLTVPQILLLVRRALELKQLVHAERSTAGPASAETIPLSMAGKTLGILFTKRSTRTRVSAETSWARLGGHPLFLGQDDIQLGKGGESWRDTAVVVSSMVDALLARVGGHEEIELLAKYSTVPVINALTAKYHPLQILADIMTLYEVYVPDALSHPQTSTHPLPPLPPLKVAWVGDANNILNSLLVALPRLGVTLHAATPAGYDIDAEILAYAQSHAATPAAAPVATRSAAVAVKDADVIVTDTWVSMGQEAEKAKRLAEFDGYMVTEKMAAGAKPGWKFMHCLPRKQEEVDDEVFYSPERSLVWAEAENRKYTVMAVFEAFCTKSAV
ncbi:ornithine carbamoyltransferase [Phlyctochytrium bullatum]|nr:ornithine carbamoyltransferase [Phlyctochytrium bullatum]